MAAPTGAQRSFGARAIRPASRKKKLTPEEVASGMPLEQLRGQQARLKREFRERQARREEAT